MLVNDLVRAMERLAPPQCAEEWDRVGLLVGHRSREVRGPVLLTIDLTERVLDEALALRAGAVVAYHPPLWDPITRLTDETSRARIVLRAAEAGLAIYSPHTALDNVEGGVTDWLCEGLSGGGVTAPTPDGPRPDHAQPGRIAGDCRSMRASATLPATEQVKIVTFLPERELEQVRAALASSGAGIIGNYQVCSFAVRGEGTFLGGEGSKPAVGRAGELERHTEARLEMVCSRAALPLALETLRRFHPYEEPALDIYALEPKPRRRTGAGRRLTLDRPASLRELAERFKTFLARPRMRYAAAGDETRPVTRLGVVPGAGASLLKDAIADGCEVFVTGEMKHHEVIEALHNRVSVILGGHTNTERGYLARLAVRLRAELQSAATAGGADAASAPGTPVIDVRVSAEDHDPVVTI
jgi:dinuclear metal center YbgI/SA1388 family protein